MRSAISTRSSSRHASGRVSRGTRLAVLAASAVEAERRIGPRLARRRHRSGQGTEPRLNPPVVGMLRRMTPDRLLRRSIPLARPDIGQREIDLVTEVLSSDVLAMGPFGARFERDLAALVGRREGIACSSGTAGLHMGVRALGHRTRGRGADHAVQLRRIGELPALRAGHPEVRRYRGGQPRHGPRSAGRCDDLGDASRAPRPRLRPALPDRGDRVVRAGARAAGDRGCLRGPRFDGQWRAARGVRRRRRLRLLPQQADHDG